jgi:hypothetical protein
MGLLQKMQRLGVALALSHVVFLAGLGTSHAEPSNAAETAYVHGPPCNDLCKAYMAWSNRMMANLHPSRPQLRVLAHYKKPDRPAHHASDTRQVGVMPFAEHRRRPEMASHAEDIPHVQAESSEPAATGRRSFPADQVVTADTAYAGVATSDAPGVFPVSETSPPLHHAGQRYDRSRPARLAVRDFAAPGALFRALADGLGMAQTHGHAAKCTSLMADRPDWSFLGNGPVPPRLDQTAMAG